MPIPRYLLDDRNFDDLVTDLVARIPAHTPEWTNPQVGDPGRTLIDLFAWLADTILYRVNLLPERQRLEFLRLLNIPMCPARAATGLVKLEVSNEKITRPVYVPPFTTVQGPVDFETTNEITVLPVSGKVFAKRKPTEEEETVFSPIKEALEDLYGMRSLEIGPPDENPPEEISIPYITEPLFQDVSIDPVGFDFGRETIDQTVWIALLAADNDSRLIEEVKRAFDPDELGARVIHIGIEPCITLSEFDENVHRSLSMNDLWQWEMPSSRDDVETTPYTVPYLPLEIKRDTTDGFIRRGVVQLALPSSEQIALPANSVDDDIYAGTGNHPPRVDDEDIARRLVSWIRLLPKQRIESMALSWLGINAVKIDQRKTIRNVLVATSRGAPDQTIQLPAASIEVSGFDLQVEERGVGYKNWQDQPLHTASHNDRIFDLDSEAGIVRFGDGLQGTIPEEGSRIRVTLMRYGGGRQGNMAPGNLTAIAHPDLTATQPVATRDGEDAETLDAAEKRIPEVLNHQYRAVTTEDYVKLAALTPGVAIGRVEVLPKFKPQQRLFDVVGVMSVMVVPKKPERHVPNPRPDRNIRSRVFEYLDARRPIGVELYVIGPEYVPIGLGVSITIRNGFAKHQVFQNAQHALRDFLWPLSPDGHLHAGWPLGRYLVNQEAEVVVARVAGVRTVEFVNLFRRNRLQKWAMAGAGKEQTLPLEPWQLPELLAVVVVEDEAPITDLDEALAMALGVSLDGTADGDSEGGIAMPVVPEICK